MRKYYQAALAVTAIVSLVSLLFYRHEYYKLRYVLEVFNYFGKPNQKSIGTNCTNNVPIFTKFNMKFEEPLSSWQRLDNDLYVYSAYNIREKEVQVIGFGSLNSIQDMQCVIFFENEIKPILGSFTYVSIDSNFNFSNVDKSSNYHGYHFYCTYTKNAIPVGITFLTKSNTYLNDTPILPIRSQSYSSNYTSVGVCVSPPLTKPMHLTDMFAFINFHDVIGMDNFIIYDFGIPNDFNSNLKDASKFQNPYWKFTYTTVPWNFPFSGIHSNVIKNVIQADCLYRTYKKVMYVTTISWEEYLVLKYHHSLIDLVADFKRSRMKSNHYKINTLTFCTQQADNTDIKNSTFTIFKKTRFDPSITDNRPTYIYNAHEILKKDNTHIQEIRKDLVTLNRYKYCFEKPDPDTGTQETSILRFKEDIQNSPMFVKFIMDSKVVLSKR
ncbi:uncharacterized protein LOC128893556 [Hylaeus anthracinus]|uniref:uncharacterized protein LOC128893556 n=1 Tax=Hylaeus anthracinus TaxID=313031 RepID=UPI0023B958D8|nr:uncharacterized protein LOC128893556 [Hylaeus anthracinus]